MSKRRMVEKPLLLEKSENIIKAEYVQFDLAFSSYKKLNPNRAILMKDTESIKLFVQKRVPSLSASQADFNKILDSF